MCMWFLRGLWLCRSLLFTAYNLHQTRPDKKGFAQPDEYALYVTRQVFARFLPHQIDSFEKELATGDTKSASDRLRGFFEQYFHEGTDSLVSPFGPHIHIARRTLFQQGTSTYCYPESRSNALSEPWIPHLSQGTSIPYLRRALNADKH